MTELDTEVVKIDTDEYWNIYQEWLREEWYWIENWDLIEEFENAMSDVYKFIW